MTVGDISDDVLLGADIIQNGQQRPADLLLSEELMILRETPIPLLLFGTPGKTRQARAADHYIIPPMCEMILGVYVDRDGDDPADSTTLIPF